jgi:hypothetical protein
MKVTWRSAAVCGSVAVLTSMAAGQTLTTTFASNNNFAGNMFDLKAINNDLMVDSWDVNINLPGQAANVSVYWRLGTFIGSENTQVGWNHLGTANVSSAGQDQPTNVPLGGLVLPQGQTIGVYVFLTDYTVNPAPPGVPQFFYTNIPPALPQYANSDLELNGGIGKGSPPFTGGTFAPRMWNGTVHYHIDSCYPDCDTSTGPGVLDIFDFLCFQNRFEAGSAYACDCDTSTGGGVCDVFDFLCFQNAFAAGCP